VVNKATIWSAICLVALCCGCCSQSSSNDDAHLAAVQLSEINNNLQAIAQQLGQVNTNLEKIANRRLLPIGKGDPEPAGEKSLLIPTQQPDFRKAFAKGLQGVAALTGNQKVIEWFQGLAVDIRKTIAPVDLGGVLDKKVKALSADRVNQLLNEN
jgi:hypothetical protein